jgi:hypothetical protein
VVAEAPLCQSIERMAARLCAVIAAAGRGAAPAQNPCAAALMICRRVEVAVGSVTCMCVCGCNDKYWIDVATVAERAFMLKLIMGAQQWVHAL